MSRIFQSALVAMSLINASAASAQSFTAEQARAIIAPWYSLFNVGTHGDVKAVHEQVLTADYESCAGYLPGECWGRDTSLKVVGNFSNSIPDLKFDIKEVLVAGDRIIVRGEVTGTPAHDLFGQPPTGKSFRISNRHSDNSGRKDRKDLSHGELVERIRATPGQVVWRLSR